MNVVATGHADVRVSTAMTNNYNNDDVIDGDFPNTLGEILGTPFMATPAFDLDLAYGIGDFNVNFNRIPLLSPLFPLPPPFTSLPPSAIAGEPT